MKKYLSIALLVLIGLTLLATGCSGSPSSNSASVPAGGNYTNERDVTAEDLAIFEEASQDMVGAEYIPLKVSTQVVAGTNYKFYCKVATVSPEAEESFAYVTIFVSLDENEPPTISDIEDV